MTAVFVHGVPETTKVWAPLVSHLQRNDVALLGLPGFGSPLPAGFDATMETYATWLRQQLDGFDEVDLVGHDWGAILSLRVLADRPPTVRSWAIDLGDLDASFEWHDTAKTWQTPGEGEAWMDGMIGASLQDRALLLGAVGVAEIGVMDMAAGLDATMGDAILKLYRSATDLGAQWGPGIDRITGPGLLIESMDDPFRTPGKTQRLAERTGAQVAQLEGSGHFWPLDHPERAAQLLTDFWSSLD